MDRITKQELKVMKDVDVKTVDPDMLVDIRDVKVNMDLPKNERILDFMKQIKNPYCFKCDDIIIKVTFEDNEV